MPTDTTNYTTLTISRRELRDHQGDADGDADGEQFPAGIWASRTAATVSVSASSVPGTVTNILTGGTATKTAAGTYAVTADFVPTDTANYTSLIDLAAGNFVITKATPTATLTVTNSPQTYTGVGRRHILPPVANAAARRRRRGTSGTGPADRHD